MTADGDSQNLPEGWGWFALNEIAEISPRHPRDLADSLEVTFVPMAAISDDSPDFKFTNTRPLSAVRKGFTHFAEGDVLFAKITPCMENGKAAIARRLKNGVGCGTTELHVIRPTTALSADYLYRFIHQDSVRSDAAAHFSGTAGQLRVPSAFVTGLRIPLPPSAEQRRIVAKVETLLARVQAARQRLARVPLLLKRFRQAILTAACNGQLTAGWRASNPHTSVSDALDSAKALVDNQAVKHLLRRGTAGLPEVERPEAPAEWEWRTVRELVEYGAILDFQDGNHGSLYPRATDFSENGVQFLTAQQVFDNRVLLDKTPRLNLAKARLLRIGFARPGDVLLTHNATVGRVAVLPRFDGDLILGTSVTYYRTNPDLFLPEYLSYQMQGRCWQGQLESVMEQTTRNQVSVTKQVEFWLLLPTIAEQHEIVRRVDALFKLADAIERRVAAATARAERLTQTIIAKAFRGELVPTEAELARQEGRDYETAEQLLARIHREKAATEAETVPAGRGKAKMGELLRQTIDRGRTVLDLLLLLECWNKPVSIGTVEPALVLMKNEAARETLLAGKATKRSRRALQELPQFFVGLDGVYAALEREQIVRRVGHHALELTKPEVLARATRQDRERAAEVIEAIQKLNDIRKLPAAVAAATHERYTVSV
jgi:type I restriction enzyme S subunit